MQKKSNAGEAWKRRYPEGVLLVTTRSREGKPNVMTVGWNMIASDEPPMLMLAIDGGAYTLELIRKTKEFVVSYPHAGMAADALYAGTRHGHKLDKFARIKAKTGKALKVKAPIFTDAVANFECRLEKIYQPGNCPLVVGKVVAVQVNRNPNVRRLFTLGINYRMGGAR